MEQKEQLVLLDKPEFGLAGPPTPRPSRKDEYVKDRVLEIFMPKVQEYLGKDWPTSKEEQQYYFDAIRKVLFSHGDGYARVRQLERNHSWLWEGSSELVELLEDLPWDEREAIRELTAQWVKCYNVQSPVAVGDTVRVLTGLKKGLEGVVSKILEERAEVQVSTPDCVPEGRIGTQGYLFHYEEVEKIETPA